MIFSPLRLAFTSRSSTLAGRNGTEEKVGQQSVFHMKGVWWFDSLRSICSACTCCWVSGLIFISFLGFCLFLRPTFASHSSIIVQGAIWCVVLCFTGFEKAECY
ncbi:hypothetical protein I7I48_08850 [Histoplasma ohiense]|nr:hypothetical protein I7I48_08850 [Histoplasma ohiense (nom. inval.)]